MPVMMFDAAGLHAVHDEVAQVVVDVVQAVRAHQTAAGQDRGGDSGGVEEGAVLDGDLRPPMITHLLGS